MKARESARLRAGSRVYQRVPHILLWLRRVVHHNNQYSQMIERRDLMAIESGKLVIVMVGLPGRGKSYISRRLELFMSWLGDNVKVFNVGKYRRQLEDHAKGASKVRSALPAHASAHRRTHKLPARCCPRMLAPARPLVPSSLSSRPPCCRPRPRLPLTRAHALLHHPPRPSPAAPGLGRQADFFDPNNQEARAVRERAAGLAMSDMLDFLDGPGQVALFDGTISLCCICVHIIIHICTHADLICMYPHTLYSIRWCL